MIIKKPAYYDKFRCIADKCENTCCSGWQIEIDEKSQKKYENATGNYCDVLKNSITKNENGETVFKQSGLDCIHLKNGLCEIQKNLGENFLCDTCKNFPRWKNIFGGTTECGISTACPEASRLIFAENELGFNCEITDELPSINNIDAEEYLELTKKRNSVFEKIKNAKSKDDIFNALYNVINNCEKGTKSNEKLSSKNALEFCNTFDYSSKESALFLNEQNSLTIDEFKNLSFYYVYRYFMLPVLEDIDIESTVEFIIFSLLVINETGKKGTVVFAKEVENCEENMKKLFSYLKNKEN